MEQDLLKLIKEQKVTFFVGAGISMIPPSCLPSWWQINHAILDALAEEANSIVTGPSELVELIKKREEDGKLPPEYVAEIITTRIGSSYFDVLKCLEGTEPNKIHLWLATLAQMGLLKAIITTNFDTLIEKAFDRLNVPLQVLVHPQDFEGIEALDEEQSCLLLKLHGTASQPQTCIDTLAQRKKGLHPSITKALSFLGVNSTWLFLGYSGADLDAEPNYLGIRARKALAPGFYWLHLPGKDPLAAVSSLVTYYGEDRGRVVFGALPTYLENLKDLLPRSSIFSRKIAAPRELSLNADQVTQKIQDSILNLHAETKNWANKQGSGECCIILADIAISAGQPEETKMMLEHLLVQKDEIQLSDFALGLLYQELGEILKNYGNNQEALNHYLQSITYYQQANSEAGVQSSSQDAAIILQSLGSFAEAEKIFKDRVEHSRSQSESEDYVRTLLNIGNFYKETGKFNESLDNFNEALPIAIKNGYEILKANCFSGKAEIEYGFGQHQEAVEDVSQAISTYSRLGNQAFESDSLLLLARLFLKQGKTPEGLQKLTEAKERANAAGDKNRMLRADQVNGEFLLQSGKYAEAESILRETAQQAEAIGEFSLAIVVWESVGISLQSLGKYDAAKALYLKALALAEEHGQEVHAGGLKNNLGIVAELNGELSEALEFYAQACLLFERFNDIEGIARAKGNIANIHYRQGNFPEAKTFYEETLTIFEQLGYVDGIMSLLSNIANVAAALGDLDQAKKYHVRAIQLAEQYQQEGLKDNFQLNF